MEITKRNLIQYLCYYLLPVVMFFATFFTVYSSGDAYELVVSFGDFALKLLILILFVKPLGVIFPKISLFKKLVTFRRELGVLAFWAAIFHSITLMYYLGLFSVNEALKYTSFTSFALWGFLALIGMTILGLTSNKLSVMKLKKNWKKLQYLAYPTFLFVLVHVYLSYKDITYIIIGIIFILLKIIEFHIRNKSKIKTS